MIIKRDKPIVSEDSCGADDCSLTIVKKASITRTGCRDVEVFENPMVGNLLPLEINSKIIFKVLL